MTPLSPLGEYLLIEQHTTSSTTASGIILTDSKEKPGMWTVVAIWPGRLLDNGTLATCDDVSIGDTVYFTKYAPEEIERSTWSNKKTYLIVKYSSILAKVHQI